MTSKRAGFWCVVRELTPAKNGIRARMVDCFILGKLNGWLTESISLIFLLMMIIQRWIG